MTDPRQDVAEELIAFRDRRRAKGRFTSDDLLTKAAALLREPSEGREPDAWAVQWTYKGAWGRPEGTYISPEAADRVAQAAQSAHRGEKHRAVPVWFGTPSDSPDAPEQQTEWLTRCRNCGTRYGSAYNRCPNRDCNVPRIESQWLEYIQWRRAFICVCGYQGWEYYNIGRPNTLVCVKCGNGKRASKEEVAAMLGLS